MLTQKQKVIVMIVIVALSFAAFIVGYALLPDVLTVQINEHGESTTTMPKFIGLLLPFLLSTIPALLYYKLNSGKALFVSVVGIVVFLLEFVINLE